MSILKTIECDVCGDHQTELKPNAGWPGWGEIRGVALNNVANPNLCPVCLERVMEHLDQLASGEGRRK